MDWSQVNGRDVLVALQKAELRSPPRPWSDFFARFSVPKNTTKAVSRLKCNLFYYRSNYVLITAASTSIMLLRNPLGTVSLGLLVFGGMLFNDAVAQQASRRVVTILRKIDPQRAVKICGVPGGHDGCSVPPGRQAVVKIAGFKRSTVASCVLAAGTVVAIWTGASRTVTSGLGLGALLVGLHATMRTPNLKARLSSTQRRVTNGSSGDPGI